MPIHYIVWSNKPFVCYRENERQDKSSPKSFPDRPNDFNPIYNCKVKKNNLHLHLKANLNPEP